MIEHLLTHWLGFLHLMAALAALSAGAGVIFTQKGTLRHKRLGRCYVLLMLAMNGTALLDYELFGRFGPFHWMVLLSLATVIGGYSSARRKTNEWKHAHAYYMAGSYIGLIAAAVAEVTSRIPGWAFGPSVLLSSAIVGALGIWLMFRLVPGTIAASDNS